MSYHPPRTQTQRVPETFQYLKIPQAERDKASPEDRLVIDNIPLVAHFVQKITAITQVTKDDLFQAGLEGLTRASKGFNSKRNVRFSSYASLCILREIWGTVYAGAVLHLSYKASKKLMAIRDMVKEYQSKHDGTEPTVQQIANKLGMEYDLTYTLFILARDVVPGHDGDMIDDLPSRHDGTDNEDYYMLSNGIRDIVENIESLPALEGAVMLLRLGFFNGRGYDIDEVGFILSLVPGRVRDIEYRAIQHIREPNTRKAISRTRNISPWDMINNNIRTRHDATLTRLSEVTILLSEGNMHNIDDELDIGTESDQVNINRPPKLKTRRPRELELHDETKHGKSAKRRAKKKRHRRS